MLSAQNFKKFSNIDLEDLNESKAIGRQSFGKAG